MTPEQAAALRAEFKPEQIGKLPRVTCSACTKANKERRGTTCAEHKKIRCEVCKNYISERHIHLDYVGHAAVTDRLLQVDPDWTWEFVPDYPLTHSGLWIKLTVGGVSRFGFGDGDDPKVMIGDAIRNAAMRFGVALDLWAKEDLRSPDESSGPPTSASSRASGGSEPSEGAGEEVHRGGPRTSAPSSSGPPASATPHRSEPRGPEPPVTVPSSVTAAEPEDRPPTAASGSAPDRPAPKERIAELTMRVEKLKLGDWVKAQHYAWPWDDDVCDVIEQHCNLKVSAA